MYLISFLRLGQRLSYRTSQLLTHTGIFSLSLKLDIEHHFLGQVKSEGAPGLHNIDRTLCMRPGEEIAGPHLMV